MRTLGAWIVLCGLTPASVAGQRAGSLETAIAALAPRSGAVVSAFYAERAFAPAWVAESGSTSAARQLVSALDTIDRDGLDPRDYGTRRLRRLLGRTDRDSLAALDLALSAAFVRAGRDLAEGRVRPEAIDTMWTGQRGAVDLAAALRAAVSTRRPADALAALAPSHAAYDALRHGLSRYRALVAAGGWPRIGPGPTLALGDSGARVVTLRARLAASGDLAEAAGGICDAACEEAVRGFQRRHGLEPDGLVGPETRVALDHAPAHWARIIALNLERWRWAPRDAGSAPVIVNSAAFTASRHGPEGAAWHSAAIVGRPEWPTPIVAGRLRAIVFAPRWNVPRDIALLEIMPAVQSDTLDLRRAGFCFVDSLGRSVPDDSLVWEALADSASGVRLLQVAGPGNPLGGIKLVFWNRYNVSLHATPQQELFARRVRALSHGCVRLERAVQLATELLADRPDWAPDSVARAAADTVERIVALANGPMVILGYWTAWAGEDSVVHFRPDVYGWDARLAAARGR